MVETNYDIKVADETFIAVALLHREQPERADFTISEIVERAEKENLFGRLRPGVRVHATLHCVANRAPNPGRYRMLYATGEHTRRLLCAGDPVNSDRTGKTWPNMEDVPPAYHDLIDWAKQRYGTTEATREPWLHNLFQLFGLGKDAWKGEDPDEYVRKLREGWE
jgi:hypothetical protein